MARIRSSDYVWNFICFYDMKSITAIIIYLSCFIPSLLLSFGNYMSTREHIIEDVNQALAQTILQKSCDRITQDTLHVFRSHLKMEQLKETSYLSICTDEPSRISFCSDTMSYRCGVERLHVRAYPNCTRAAVFSMSEQTVPGILFIASLLWGMFSMAYFHRKKDVAVPAGCDGEMSISYGNLHFSESCSQFLNGKDEPVHFTPMQTEFMKMLMASEYKKLPVDEICDALWPGKENAKESLYTLVRRLKPVVESSSNIRIVSDKGGYYTLVIENS